MCCCAGWPSPQQPAQSGRDGRTAPAACGAWPALRALLPLCGVPLEVRAQQLRESVGTGIMVGPDPPSELCSCGIFIMNLDFKIYLLNLWVIQS